MMNEQRPRYITTARRIDRENQANHVIAIEGEQRFGCRHVYLDDWDQTVRLGADTTINGVTWASGAKVTDDFVSCVLTAMRLDGWNRISQSLVWDTVHNIAYRQRRNALRDWLSGLVWDGVPRLDTWLPVFAQAADVPFNRAAGAKWLCAAVGRVMEPGLKFDSVLLLVGRKGGGKSSVLRVIGGDRFAEVHHLGTQGSRGNHAAHGAWVIELPEMDRLIRNDTQAAEFKAWVSLRCDRVKKPYARTYEDVPRSFVLAATTNETAWLRDTQDERRYWPVRVGDTVDVAGLAAIREQLLAEAVSRWRIEPLFMDTADLRDGMKEALGDLAAENPLEVAAGRWAVQVTMTALKKGTAADVRLSIDDLPDTDMQNDTRRRAVRSALKDFGMRSRRPKKNGRSQPEVWTWPDDATARAFCDAWSDPSNGPADSDF